MATYDSSAPPKRVRGDKREDSPKDYLNPFKTPLAHKKLKGERQNYNV